MVDLKEIYKPIKKELKRVEARLQASLKTDDKFISSLSKFLLRSPGKRLRPTLVLLSAKVGQAETSSAIDLATAIELIHTATLVHDDVIDNAELRRKQASLNKKFGSDAAILFGDYLYSKAFAMISALNLPAITSVLLQTTNAICQGEMQQLSRVFRPIKEKDYFEIISGKTASLFGTCCETGGLVAGADKKVVELLKQYGYNLGVSFQIVDDCLDLTNNEKNTGKTSQLDAKGGKMTLPQIYLQQNSAKTIPESINYSLKVAGNYQANALSALKEIKDSDAKASLEYLVKYVVSRVN